MMKTRNRQMTERIELPNQEKIQTLGKKETFKYLGILEVNTIKHEELKEDFFKKYLRKTRKLRNQTLHQKSHQRDKYLGCPPRKILGTILEVDERRTPLNGPENKKTDDDV